MPLFYLRRLTGRQRTASANRHLARYLAFVAGATNAGGFLAVRQYTSHMTGVVASTADNVVAGDLPLVLRGVAAFLSFLCGSFLTTLCVRWARSRSMESEYALPLAVEAILLLIFGCTGHVFTGGYVVGTVMLLCFTMGVQNAVITKLSNSVIRTTHLTGMVTDIGIALGRVVHTRWGGKKADISAELVTLRLLSSLIALFFIGGMVGAFGFRRVGFLFALPLAFGLLLLAVLPVIDDLRQRGDAAA